MSKGQYITLEHVFFFVIGVIMTILIYYSFSGIAENIRNENTKYQLLRIGESIRWDIVSVYTTGNLTNSSIVLKREIPRDVSDCIYRISVENGLNLNCTETEVGVVLNLYDIEIFIETSEIYSSRGIINIIYEGGRI